MIVIGGGVGPMAGVGLHKNIIENTQTDGTDQTHLRVAHFSASDCISDRTKFLLGEVMDSPAEGMAKVMQMAEAAAQKAGQEAVAGVPCNTFHAPKIWDRFIEILQEGGSNLKMLHMLNETADYIATMLPNAKNIGLMSTTGTRSVKVYNQILEPRGLNIIEVPEEIQPELHDSIYNPDWGIKAIAPVTEKAQSNFKKYADILQKQGAEAIILGCTEIPLALTEPEHNGIPLVDPMVALARRLVQEANPEKLKK